MSFEETHQRPVQPIGRPEEADSSQQVDLSRYRHRPPIPPPATRRPPTPPPAPRPARSGWTTELTTSLTGWILGPRAAPDRGAADGRTRRAAAILIVVTAAMVLVGVIAAVLFNDWIGDTFG